MLVGATPNKSARTSRRFAWLETSSGAGIAGNTCKPTASRNASIESFVVCRGFGYGQLSVDKCLDLELEGSWDELCGGVGGLRLVPGEDVIPSIVEFVSCSKFKESSMPSGVDFMDSDKSYPVDEAKAPLAPPIRPPWEAAKKRSG